MGDTGSDRAAGRRRGLRRLTVPLFLVLVVGLFGAVAWRALPNLPILTQPRVAEMPLRRMFSTALHDNYQARAILYDALTTPIFMDKLRGMLKVERKAARTLAMRPVGSEFWYHRSVAAQKSGRASFAREYGLHALRDGPFTRGYAADRVAITVRYWDDLSQAERTRAYAYMRKMVYYTDSILVAEAAEDQPGVEDHLRIAVAGNEPLEARLAVRLRNGRHHLFRRR